MRCKIAELGNRSESGELCSCYVYAFTATAYDPQMHDRPNTIVHFDTIRLSLQARAVLDVLAANGAANSRLLGTWLGTIGLASSARALSDLLDRMEKDGLVRLEEVDAYRVVLLRRFGGEVATGREVVEWIVPRELPE